MTLVGNIKDLGFNSSIVSMTFTLVNSMGKKIYAQSEDMNIPIFSEETISSLENGDFSIELIANETIKRNSTYKLKMGGISFTLYIPKTADKINILCVINKIDYDGIANIYDHSTGMYYEYDMNFAKKFEKYILSQKQNLTRAEEKLCEKFVALVNLPEDEKSPDILQLNKYLGSI